MTNYTITNIGTVAGGLGIDKLTYIYTYDQGGVWTSNWSEDVNGSYGGYFNGTGGNDGNFSGIEQFEFIDNGGGDDIIRTGDYNDTLRGGGGNDHLNSGKGHVLVDGGDGIDIWEADVSAFTGAVVFNLNTASTFLTYSSVQNIEAARVTTGIGNDSLTGHRTAYAIDNINTGGGNDSLNWFMNGADTINGGSGFDTLRVTYNAATNGVWLLGPTADANGALTGQFNGMGANDLNFQGIERIAFTDLSGGDDIIETGRFNDTLRGGGGNDRLASGAGNDWIDGGAGIDTWAGYRGAATLAQVINLNTISYLGSGASVRNIEAIEVTTGSGADRITGHATSGLRDVIATGAGNDSVFLRIGGADEVRGGYGADRLEVTVSAPSTGIWLTNLGSGAGGHTGTFNGDGSNDIVFTGIDSFAFRDLRGGADIINTGGGADLLSGGGGNDLLNGGGGNDKLFGGAGNDRLIAGFGNDRLTGNAGVDRFEYDRLIRQGSDIITDFTNGADRIRIVGGSMADVAISSVNSGLDTRIVLDSGTVIVLEDVVRSTINSADFLFS